MSKDYWVTAPVDCHIGVSVQADSEEEAIEKALESNISVNIEGAELDHFELIKEVNTGNVCHITQWDVEVFEQ